LKSLFSLFFCFNVINLLHPPFLAGWFLGLVCCRRILTLFCLGRSRYN
jgi:hypothetical protein